MLRPEQKEQIKLFQWIRLHPEIKHCAFAIPNDGKRSVRLGAIMKKMGMLPGVPDIFIAYPITVFSGMFIELKAKNINGVYGMATPNQILMINELRKQGYHAVVCNGADEAIGSIEYYLSC